MTDENKDGVKPEGSEKKDDTAKNEGPSKMPDLKEIGTMAGKLFHDVKRSIGEIITDYKSKRPVEETSSAKGDKKEETPETDVVAEEAAAATAAQEEAPKAEEEAPAADENEEKKDG